MKKRNNDTYDINDIPLDVQETAKQANEDIKNSFNNMIDNIDKQNPLKVEEFKKQVNDVIDKADESIRRFMGNSTVQSYWKSLKNNYNELTDAIIEIANKVYNNTTSNDEIAKYISYIKSKAKSCGLIINEKYQQFIHNPSVRKTVVNTVNIFSDIFDSTISVIKSAINEKR